MWSNKDMEKEENEGRYITDAYYSIFIITEGSMKCLKMMWYRSGIFYSPLFSAKKLIYSLFS